MLRLQLRRLPQRLTPEVKEERHAFRKEAADFALIQAARFSKGAAARKQVECAQTRPPDVGMGVQLCKLLASSEQRPVVWRGCAVDCAVGSMIRQDAAQCGMHAYLPGQRLALRRAGPQGRGGGGRLRSTLR